MLNGPCQGSTFTGDFSDTLLVISLVIFMLLQWPISRLLRENTLREGVSGIPYRGEGMALLAIAVSFVSVAAMVAGLSKPPNGAEMAVFCTVGTMALSWRKNR